jgi:hypothetical protein
MGGVDRLESRPSNMLNIGKTCKPYPPGPHQFLQAWALVTHRHLSQPLLEEYLIWTSNLKMGMSNAIDTVSSEESIREFAERMLQLYDLFQMADPLMLSQELRYPRYPILRIFKAGLPEEYSSQVTKNLQELGVRSMDKDQQLIHLITRMQSYHEFIISARHDNLGSPSAPSKNAASTGIGNTLAQPQGYVRSIRRAYPSAHLAVFNEGDHQIDMPSPNQVHEADMSGTDHLVDDEQDRVASLQEELVEVHSNATFPSTMHPRGNNKAPLPVPSQQPSQQRQEGPSGAAGPQNSTPRSYGAQGVSSPQSRLVKCDIFDLDHWTRNCP